MPQRSSLLLPRFLQTSPVNNMDLNNIFYYDSHWRILVCKKCNTVPQTKIYQHVSKYHNPLRAHKPAHINAFERSIDHLPYIRDPDEISRLVRPLPDSAPIPFLVTFHDGVCCLLCEDDRERYICRGRTAIEEHLRKTHGRPLRRPGPRGDGAIGGVEGLVRAGLVKSPIACQQAFYPCSIFHMDPNAYGLSNSLRMESYSIRMEYRE